MKKTIEIDEWDRGVFSCIQNALILDESSNTVLEFIRSNRFTKAKLLALQEDTGHDFCKKQLERFIDEYLDDALNEEEE